MEKKYLLCRPLGGLNDVLCQINYCYNYCIKFNRTLLIDTTFIYEHNSFSDSFDKYFDFIKKVKIHIITNKEQIYNIIIDINKTIYPTSLKNQILNYQITFDESLNILEQFKSNEENLYLKKIFFHEDIVVHHSFGGGIESHKIINLMKINKSIAYEFKQIYLQIKKPYIGIHIRNTDMTSDYKKFLEKNFYLINSYENLLLATDSIESKKYFYDMFKDKQIFNYSKVLETNEPLHTQSKNKHLSFTNTLIDLLLLVYSEKLIISTETSGFANLASYIHNNKSKCNNFLTNIKI